MNTFQSLIAAQSVAADRMLVKAVAPEPLALKDAPAHAPMRYVPKESPTSSALCIGVGLLVFAAAFCLLAGPTRPSGPWVGGALVSTGAGGVVLWTAWKRMQRAYARLLGHMSRVNCHLFRAEHKLFQSHARCVELEVQLLSIAAGRPVDDRDEPAVWQAEVARVRAMRGAIRMLAAGADELAGSAAGALRTLARHPKSTAAKTRARDGLVALRSCLVTIADLVETGTRDEPVAMLLEFRERLMAQCDRADLNADVWAVAEGLLSQANALHRATQAGTEGVLLERWLGGGWNPARPARRRSKRPPRGAAAPPF